MNPDLMRPSLAHSTAERPIYSTTTLLIPAFFAGPAAAAVVFGINAWRARRLARDGILVVAGIVIALAVPIVFVVWLPPENREWIRVVSRAFGVALAGVYYLRHRAVYRAQNLFGTESPSGWLIGTAALVAGIAVSALVGLAMSET
jgi:hypothetical protein